MLEHLGLVDERERISYRIEELHLFVLLFRLFFSLVFCLLHVRRIEEDFEELFVYKKQSHRIQNYRFPSFLPFN